MQVNASVFSCCAGWDFAEEARLDKKEGFKMHTAKLSKFFWLSYCVLSLLLAFVFIF